MCDKTGQIIKLVLWILVIILGNAVYSMGKKESFTTYVLRTVCILGMSLFIWFGDL